MKRIIPDLGALLCRCRVRSGRRSEAALKALSLGNEKFVLEPEPCPGSPGHRHRRSGISVPATDLFGLSESQLAVVKPEGGFGPKTGIAVQGADLATIVVLDTGQAVWAVYANTLVASPD